MSKLEKKNLIELINSQKEPCVSIYLSTISAAGNEVKKMKIKFKNMLNSAEEELLNYWNLSQKDIKDILKPAYKLLEDRDFWQHQKNGLAVFLAPSEFHYFQLPLSFNDDTYVSKYYNIKQLIPEIWYDRRFYVLALSQNSNRLFSCTKDYCEELDLDSPDSLEDSMKYDDPEESLQAHGHSSNGNEAIFHGHAVADQESNENLLVYLRSIERAANKYLHNSKSPLILISVEELYSLYKTINTYEYLLDDFVHGNPDRLKPDEIYKKCWKYVSKEFLKEEWEAIEKYNNLKENGKTSDQVDEIVPAAYYSKVEDLLVKENSLKYGKFIPEDNQVSVDGDRKDKYDLYNYALMQTISHGGNVYLLEEELMPDDLDIAAIYRYE